MKARKKKYCRRCNTQVKREKTHMKAGYPWYCPCCDEDIFNFEVYKQRRK